MTLSEIPNHIDEIDSVSDFKIRVFEFPFEIFTAGSTLTATPGSDIPITSIASAR
jgi:hypothetical protein